MCFPLEKWSVQGSSHMVGCNVPVVDNFLSQLIFVF